VFSDANRPSKIIFVKVESSVHWSRRCYAISFI